MAEVPIRIGGGAGWDEVLGGRGGDAFADVGGQGPCFAGLEVNAHAGQKSARRKFLGLLICHFVGKDEGFFANLLEGRADGDGVAGEQFAFVLDALFHRDQANPFLTQPRGRQPHGRKKLPGGLIKFAHVPHYVHVAHVIAVPRIDRSKMRKNWFGHGFVHNSSLKDSQRISFYLNRSRNWRQGGAHPRKHRRGRPRMRYSEFKAVPPARKRGRAKVNPRPRHQKPEPGAPGNSNWRWCGMGKRWRVKSSRVYNRKERVAQDPRFETKLGYLARVT